MLCIYTTYFQGKTVRRLDLVLDIRCSIVNLSPRNRLLFFLFKNLVVMVIYSNRVSYTGKCVKTRNPFFS